jgi:hypothetical protein
MEKSVILSMKFYNKIGAQAGTPFKKFGREKSKKIKKPKNGDFEKSPFTQVAAFYRLFTVNLLTSFVNLLTVF